MLSFSPGSSDTDVIFRHPGMTRELVFGDLQMRLKNQLDIYVRAQVTNMAESKSTSSIHACIRSFQAISPSHVTRAFSPKNPLLSDDGWDAWSQNVSSKSVPLCLCSVGHQLILLLSHCLFSSHFRSPAFCTSSLSSNHACIQSQPPRVPPLCAVIFF